MWVFLWWEGGLRLGLAVASLAGSEVGGGGVNFFLRIFE